MHPKVEPLRSDMLSEGRSFTVRHALRRSGLYGPTAILSRSDIFKRRWSATSDLKAPTYKNRQAIAAARHDLRRSGLYGPTAILSRSGIFKRRWSTTSDLKAPTYEDRHAIAVARHASRKSGLYGPTAILSRSDIFTRQWSATSDLKAPTYKTPVRRRLKIRHLPVEKFAAKAIGTCLPYAACGIKNSRLMRPPSTLTRSRNWVR
jgi:hypothetical protein